jgi:hypothetical protein
VKRVCGVCTSLEMLPMRRLYGKAVRSDFGVLEKRHEKWRYPLQGMPKYKVRRDPRMLSAGCFTLVGTA